MTTVFLSAYLKSYTNDTWTDLIEAPAGKTLVVKHYMFMNTGASTIATSMRVTTLADVELAILVDEYGLATDKPLNCVSAFIVLKDGDKIQVKAATAGVHFSCWGGYE